MTAGPSSAATKLSETQVEPEYADLHFVDVEIMDEKQKGWTVIRGLLDNGSQGSYVNKVLSTNALTDHHEKKTPTTMIMAAGHDSPAGPITQYNPVKIWIAGYEEQLALDTASLSHRIILGMPWHKRHNPKIDYSGNTMTFDSNYCSVNCRHYGTTIPLHPKDQPEPEIRYPETRHPETREPERGTQTQERTKTQTPEPETRHSETQTPEPETRYPETPDPETRKPEGKEPPEGVLDRCEHLRLHMQPARNGVVLYNNGGSQYGPLSQP